MNALIFMALISFANAEGLKTGYMVVGTGNGPGGGFAAGGLTCNSPEQVAESRAIAEKEADQNASSQCENQSAHRVGDFVSKSLCGPRVIFLGTFVQAPYLCD